MEMKIIKNKVCRVGCLLFAALLLLISCSSVDEGQLIVSARQYMEQHKLREAGLELRNILQQNPKNAEARFLFGELNIILGDMPSAARDFRRAKEAGWDEAESQLGLARALVGAHEFEDAADIEIKNSYPDSIRADLYGLKAYAFAGTGDLKQAEKMLEKGRALDRHAVEVLRTSIQLAISKSNFSEAKTLLEQALTRYPDNAEILLLSGYLAMRQNNNRHAATQFNKVLNGEPLNIVTFNGRQTRLALARLALLKKDTQEAEKLIAPVLKQVPDDMEANYMQALIDFEQRNYDEAEVRLLSVLKFVPDHAKSLLLYGAVNFAQRDYEQAAYYLNKYLQAVPSDITARKLLGRTFILQGRADEAEAILQPGLLQPGDDAELMALIGISQLRGGDIISGISGLESALKTAPESQVLRSELAKAYISAGQTEKAINQLDKIQKESGRENQTDMLKIVAYLRDGQNDHAVSIVHEMLKRSPDDAMTLSVAGNVFAAIGDKKEARRYYEKAILRQKDYSLAKMLLAALEEEEGNLAAAERLYLQVLNEKKSSVEPYLALSRIAKARGDEAGMVLWLEKARTQISTDLRSRLVLAEYYLRTGEQDKVGRLVKELVSLAPTETGVLAIQGQWLMRQQQFNEALKPLKALVARRPDYAPGHVLLAKAYLQLGQLSAGRGQLDMALQADEFDIPALMLQANLELLEGRPENARIYIQKVQKIQPDFAMAYFLEGKIEEKENNFNKAVRAYNVALKLQPASDVVVRLAGAYMSTGNADAAVRPLKEWLRIYPQDTEIRLVLGGIYQASGDNKAAAREYEQVVDAQPENIVALNNLAWIYSQEGLPEALLLAERAYKLAPESPGVQDTYGWILVQHGDVEKGSQLLKNAMESLPESAEVEYHYATALARMGQTDEARRRLRQLLDSGKAFSGRSKATLLLKSL